MRANRTNKVGRTDWLVGFLLLWEAALTLILAGERGRVLKIWAAEVMIYGGDFTQWTETA